MEFDRIYTEIDLGHIEENMEAMEKNLRLNCVISIHIAKSGREIIPA